ncbi:MAG: hypothetical protein K0R99_4647, partial [Microbacterium sp.]|nr:hypothetical protein [Microbacterium sp.]
LHLRAGDGFDILGEHAKRHAHDDGLDLLILRLIHALNLVSLTDI